MSPGLQYTNTRNQLCRAWWALKADGFQHLQVALCHLSSTQILHFTDRVVALFDHFPCEHTSESIFYANNLLFSSFLASFQLRSSLAHT